MPTNESDYVRLETLQAAVTHGEAATAERNELAFDMWRSGMTQREIAEVLDRVDRQCGGDGVTHAMIAKMIARMRATRETEMLASAVSS
jgi:glutaminase